MAQTTIPEYDRDPDTGELVPCVVCGHRPQRGGTGCCSLDCAKALHEQANEDSTTRFAQQLTPVEHTDEALELLVQRGQAYVVPVDPADATGCESCE